MLVLSQGKFGSLSLVFLHLMVLLPINTKCCQSCQAAAKKKQRCLDVLKLLVKSDTPQSARVSSKHHRRTSQSPVLQVCKLQQITEDSLKPFNRQFVWDAPCCLSLGFLFEWEPKRSPRDMGPNSQLLSGSRHSSGAEPLGPGFIPSPGTLVSQEQRG